MKLNRIIVVGASAGGVGALCSLVQELPDDLPAATFIVQHVGHRSILTEILQRCHGNGSVTAAKEGEPIAPGRIYVAVPDHHLVIENNSVHLRKSPRENMHRPSVDVLFRSAARAHGAKVVGVVLTGAMDDGASGLFAIKAKGGVAVVQDPKDALVPDMPSSAMQAVEVDYLLPLVKIAPLLVKLAKEPVSAKSSRNKAAYPDDEVFMADRFHPPFVCPECDGPLEETQEGNLEHFRCKIGHAFSLDSLSEAHAETLERGIWLAVRILDDRAAIQRKRAENFERGGEPERAAPLLEIADQAEHDSKILRQIIERL